MKIVGLNIEKGRLAVTVIEKGLRQTDLKDSFCSTFATDAELVEILKGKSKDWAGARLVSSIPGHFFSQRLVQFPFADRKRVEKALPFEIEDSVPFSLEDIVLDHLAMAKPDKSANDKNETAILGMMLPKTLLRQHLDLLALAGVDPQVIVPSYVGLYFVSRMIPLEGTAVLIGGNDLCLKNGKTVRACRSFFGSRETGGIRHMLKSLETEHSSQVEKAYLLTEDEGLRTVLAELGISVEQIVPEYGGKKALDSVSLGLSLCEDINFRRGEFAYQLADAGTRKRRRTLIVAGAAAGLLALANIGVKFYLTQSSYGKLDGEIKELYRQTLPDSKLVGDPVEQLRKRLDEAKKKFGVLGSGSSALDVMKAVTEGIPKEVRVNFQEFLLEGDRLKLQGEASSFEAVDKMKAELQKAPAFAEVQVLDTRMGVDNKVKFRFDIKLKQTM
jgi:type II secretory pathway component PulL